MRIVDVKKAQAPVVSITIELTSQQAEDLAHLLGTVGGDPKVWPQRKRTYDPLWQMLEKHGLATQPNPMRYQQRGGVITDSLYLASNGPGCKTVYPS